ncbi:hypothetical protein FS749_005849 [Ceratobasidium sp. UAMH 11750]|nr:hypothetical protein FS749_005849 [Ceratobasidium sp. UAMH 11750]
MIFQRYIGFIISTRRSRYRVENDPTISREFTSLRSSVWLRQDPEGPETVELVRSWVPYPTSSTMNQKKVCEEATRPTIGVQPTVGVIGSFLPVFTVNLILDRVEQEIPDLVEAFVEEVHRQFNVAVFACAAWKEEPNTMAVTQSVRVG